MGSRSPAAKDGGRPSPDAPILESPFLQESTNVGGRSRFRPGALSWVVRQGYRSEGIPGGRISIRAERPTPDWSSSVTKGLAPRSSQPPLYLDGGSAGDPEPERSGADSGRRSVC